MGLIKIVKAPVSSDPELKRLQLIGTVVQIPLEEVVPSRSCESTVTVLIKDVVKVFENERKYSAVEYWGSVGREHITLKPGEYEIIS